MIIGYARVSTEEQSLDMQLDALVVAKCEKIFQEKISGVKEDRPELSKCLKYLQKGDTLVIYKLDRLGRSLRHLVNTVLDLNEQGISLVVTSMAIDTRTPAGKLIFGILASISEFERAMIRERQAAGIKAAKARGLRFGRPDKIDPVMLADARACIAHGDSYRAVSGAYGISKSTLHRRARREVPGRPGTTLTTADE